jgi:hypothetical protein
MLFTGSSRGSGSCQQTKLTHIKNEKIEFSKMSIEKMNSINNA